MAQPFYAMYCLMCRNVRVYWHTFESRIMVSTSSLSSHLSQCGYCWLHIEKSLHSLFLKSITSSVASPLLQTVTYCPTITLSCIFIFLSPLSTCAAIALYPFTNLQFCCMGIDRRKLKLACAQVDISLSLQQP